jgi:hypothetical protein
MDAQTQQQAQAIQAVIAASVPAAQQFASQLTQGLGQLAQLAGQPVAGYGGMDVAPGLAALPGIMSQTGQQEALAQAAQAVGDAYNLPAQLQASGTEALGQFYGGAQSALQQTVQDLIDQQMTQQTDLLKQGLVNQGALDRAKTSAAATETAANTRSMAGIVEQILRNSGNMSTTQAKNAANQIIQGMKGTSAANVAGINATSRETVAQINADAKRQARAASPKGTIGPFPNKPQGVPNVRWIQNPDGTWSGIKLSGAGAPKLASPSQRTSLAKNFGTLWGGTKSSYGITTQPGIDPGPPPAANATTQDKQAYATAEHDASVRIVNWMLALHDNFPGANGLQQVMSIIKSQSPEAYKLAQRWLAGQGSNLKNVWP